MSLVKCLFSKMVIVAETNEDGTVDPFKLTFVMKWNGNSVVPNVKEWFKGKLAES